jgi:hypothetical protein
MRAESDHFLSAYPDPSFALDRLTVCLDEASGLISGDPAIYSAPRRVIQHREDFSPLSFDYPDPSLGLLPAEEVVMEEELEEVFA